MSNAKVVREKRAEILHAMEALAQQVKTEKRNMNDEEKSRFDSYDREQEGLLAQAESFERIERIEGMTRADTTNKLREEVLNGYTRKSNHEIEERNRAYAGWLFHGSAKQKQENWRAAERLGINIQSPEIKFDWLPWQSPAEARFEQRGTNPQLEGSNAAGGYTVAVDTSLMSRIDIALKAYGNIFDWATVVDTPTGAALPYPLVNDTSNTGEWTPEGSGFNVQDIAFTQNTLYAYKVDSGFVKVSWELMTDSVLDMAAFLGKAVGVRIGRRLNTYIIASGNGVNQPNNIISQATDSGVSVASATTVTYSELLGHYHSVDPAYRDEPGCAWCFSDSFLQMLRGVTDDNGRSLLMSSLEGIAVGYPRTLMGKPYYINQAVPAVTNSAKCSLFGDLSKVIIRRVAGGADGGLHLVRLNELYAANGLVAFLGWGRFDAILSDAGTHPVKFLTMHS